MNTSFYSPEEILKLGINFVDTLGKGIESIHISRKCSIYRPSLITIDSNVRIDDFCILSGLIHVGHNVHIAAYTSLFAGDTGIELQDYVGVSSRCVLYAESDDYSGNSLTNPTIPNKYKHLVYGKVILEKHVILGAGCTVLPNVTIHEGASVGSMSLVTKSLDPWGIYVGIPCKRLKDRSKQLLALQTQYEKSIGIR